MTTACSATGSEVPMNNVDVKINDEGMRELEAEVRRNLTEGAPFSLGCPGCGKSYDAALGRNECPYCGFSTEVSLG